MVNNPIVFTFKRSHSEEAGSKNSMTKFSFIAVAVLLILSDQVSACRHGFYSFGNSCYWFSPMISNFAEARSICSHLNSHLVIITSSSENDFIRQRIRLIGTDDIEAYYLGASDLRGRSLWTWDNGVPLYGNYENWAAGQPNTPTSHCLELWKELNFLWDDVNCKRERNFICEYEMN